MGGAACERFIAQISDKHVARLAENSSREGDCGVFNEDARQVFELQNLFEGGKKVCTPEKKAINSEQIGDHIKQRVVMPTVSRLEPKGPSGIPSDCRLELLQANAH